MFAGQKRRFGEANASGTISTGQSIITAGGTVHYDTNVVVATTSDSGVTAQGTHGRFAKFTDTRGQPLVSDTDKYTLSLVRGNVTTDNLPLYIPLLRPSTPAYPNPVIENGDTFWETAMQPGLALTWTGPVFSGGGELGAQSQTTSKIISWPNYGFIPYYTLPTVLVGTARTGFVNLGVTSPNPDCYLPTALTRLTTLLFGVGPITVTVSGTNSQYLTFANNSNLSVYFDFTLPPSTQIYNRGVSFLGAVPSKAGILQACKYLGFIPGQVFAIGPFGSATGTVTAPRPFQFGFRATLDVYSYKNVRWVPEDTSVAIPTSAEVASGYSGTYFDCYTYQHVLNQCINPTFQRLIYDPWDNSGTTAVPKVDQCLLRQIQNACKANCSATVEWSSSTAYAVNASVIFRGRAYYAQVANTGQAPATGSTVNSNWIDCGPSIVTSWVPNTTYFTGDAVTYLTAGTILVYYATGTTTNNIPSTLVNWTTSGLGVLDNGRLQSVPGNLAPNAPSIGTAAPVITFNPSTQGFALNLDSYGFGGTQSTNAYDGYFGVIDDSQSPTAISQQIINSSLNDQARDSWGATGADYLTPSYTIFRHPQAVFDERFVVEADDYFNQLFGNWPTLRLNYINPITNAVTSYVRYTPQAYAAGLTVPTPLPLVNPTVATTGYLPLTRTGGNQPYLYTFPQDYPSVGLMWNPIDTIVVVSGVVPIIDDQVAPPFVIGDNGEAIGTIETTTVSNYGSTSTASIFSIGNTGGQSVNSQTLRIIGEFIVKGGSMQTGQEYRNQIVFEPQTLIRMDMMNGIVFKNFDYQVFMRMKATQQLRPVTLSNGGSVNIRWCFERK